MFAHRSVLRGPSAAARTKRQSFRSSSRLGNSSRLRSSFERHRNGLSLEAPEQRQLLTATVVSVNTTADIVDPLDGFLSLREAVLEANPSPGDYEIQLPAGTYALTRKGAKEQGSLYGDLDILKNNGSVKIVGAGAGSTTIDAAGLFDAGLGYGDRIFDVFYGAKLDVQQIALAGGSTPTVSSTFSEQSGGAIRNRGGDVNVADCDIRDNTAYRGGGIYSTDGQLIVNASIFSRNRAGVGGGIHVDQAVPLLSTTIRLSVSNSTFENNEAYDGGAIATDSPAIISRSVLRSNSASNYGGGIYATATTSIEDCELSNNTAETGGGFAGYSDGQNYSIVRSSIFLNTAEDGGGVFNGGQMTISDSTISANEATTIGGGIFSVSISGGPVLAVFNSTVSGNSASSGGAIRTWFTDITIQSSTITQNTSSSPAILVQFAANAPQLRNSIVSGSLSVGLIEELLAQL